MSVLPFRPLFLSPLKDRRASLPSLLPDVDPLPPEKRKEKERMAPSSLLSLDR